VELDEVMRLTSDRFLLTGGISAMETEKFRTADEVRRYVEDLFARLRPYTHRFMLAASCNTSIRTPRNIARWMLPPFVGTTEYFSPLRLTSRKNSLSVNRNTHQSSIDLNATTCDLSHSSLTRCTLSIV
jgi:hypothetical protein